MRLDHLSLTQFRSYEQADWPLAGADVHVLLGPNGMGKTNLLEAVSVLSTGSSCLGAEEEDIMQWGKDYYRVRAKARSDAGEEKQIEVVSQRLPRKARACYLNDVRTPVGKLFGVLPTVTFLPQDLELFTGSPARRRSLLNDLLAQISEAFAQHLAVYQKVLRQRNTLLQKIAEGTGREQDLAVWDEPLAREGAAVTLAHLELLKVLQCTLGEEMRHLGESWRDAQLVYERKGEALTQEGIEEEMKAGLLHYRERDLLLKATSVGPHRHDWRMDADGRSLPTFASRGQQRTAVLALLFLQVSYMEIARGEKPIVLLDDVFSELDEERQSRLLEVLGKHQVLLTATHLPPRLGKAMVWEVQKGKLSLRPSALLRSQHVA
ncbi:MAG: DNA replication and repair protein RecF [Candidatus Peribacteraceae bacterium]|nr:DNA replication and repair protein RecF [Candidatus Peribacteraceae bacterium]